jgi:hypothetical protein
VSAPDLEEPGSCLREHCPSTAAYQEVTVDDVNDRIPGGVQKVFGASGYQLINRLITNATVLHGRIARQARKIPPKLVRRSPHRACTVQDCNALEPNLGPIDPKMGIREKALSAVFPCVSWLLKQLVSTADLAGPKIYLF